MLIDLTDLLPLFGEFCRAAGIRETVLSNRIYGESKKIRLLREGVTDLTVARYNHTLRYLADHWPDGAVWPESVSRPEQA